MPVRAPRKEKNPRIGLYTVQFGTSKKQLTLSLVKTRFFRFVRGRYRYGRWIKLPNEIKTLKQKKGFFFTKIIEYHRDREQQREERRLYYAAVQKDRGRTYKGKRARPLAEAQILRVSEKRFKEIKKRYGIKLVQLQKIQEEVNQLATTVTEGEFSNRIRQLKKAAQTFSQAIQRGLGQQKISLVFPVKVFDPSSKGASPPSGRLHEENWRDYQEGLGIDVEESIIWTITRYIRSVGRENFKQMTDSLSSRIKELYFGISMVTNLKEHPEVMLPVVQQHEGKIVLNLRNKKFLWKKKHWDRFQWRFVPTFMNTLYQGENDPYVGGPLTSSEIYFQEQYTPKMSSGKIATSTQNFKVAFIVSLIGVSSE